MRHRNTEAQRHRGTEAQTQKGAPQNHARKDKGTETHIAETQRHSGTGAQIPRDAPHNHAGCTDGDGPAVWRGSTCAASHIGLRCRQGIARRRTLERTGRQRQAEADRRRGAVAADATPRRRSGPAPVCGTRTHARTRPRGPTHARTHARPHAHAHKRARAQAHSHAHARARARSRAHGTPRDGERCTCVAFLDNAKWRQRTCPARFVEKRGHSCDAGPLRSLRDFPKRAGAF